MPFLLCFFQVSKRLNCPHVIRIVYNGRLCKLVSSVGRQSNFCTEISCCEELKGRADVRCVLYIYIFNYNSVLGVQCQHALTCSKVHVIYKWIITYDWLSFISGIFCLIFRPLLSFITMPVLLFSLLMIYPAVIICYPI